MNSKLDKKQNTKQEEDKNFTKWKLARRKFILLPFYILKSSIKDTIEQDGIEHSGYLAFLSILSLFPFLVFLFSILTYFGNYEVCINFIYEILRDLPETVSKPLAPRIDEITSGPPQGILTLAIVGIIWTASSTVEGLRTILNRAYRAPSPPTYIFGRLLSIAQFIVISLVISLTILVLVLAPAILKKAEIMFSINFSINYDLFYFRQFIIILILFLTTSSLYYHITDVKQRIVDTFPGAILAIILWTVILKLFTIYLENFNQFNLVYGSLGGFIGVLMLFYFVNLSLIIGAEFNYHFKRAYHPNSHQISIKKR
ncbi:MAG: membrane protein [Myxococcota bacterium]|jgi:membrane protein